MALFQPAAVQHGSVEGVVADDRCHQQLKYTQPVRDSVLDISASALQLVARRVRPSGCPGAGASWQTGLPRRLVRFGRRRPLAEHHIAFVRVEIGFHHQRHAQLLREERLCRLK